MPPEARFRELHFAEDGALADAAPAAAAGSDDYQADFDCRTGFSSRYDRLYITMVTTYYPDWHGRDEKMLCYTGAPLESDTEVTGHPVATLHLTCSERDCAPIVYLEDVTPEGRCVYVTEGVFRALHRKPGPNPPTLPATGPSHSFNRADAEPLSPGAPAELAFDLLPTSYLFRKGHRIRIAIAAADSDHMSRIPDGRPPLLRFFRDRLRASRIALPVMPR
jgi:putative CocE/NonD family hydrolase